MISSSRKKKTLQAAQEKKNKQLYDVLLGFPLETLQSKLSNKHN